MFSTSSELVFSIVVAEWSDITIKIVKSQQLYFDISKGLELNSEHCSYTLKTFKSCFVLRNLSSRSLIFWNGKVLIQYEQYHKAIVLLLNLNSLVNFVHILCVHNSHNVH